MTQPAPTEPKERSWLTGNVLGLSLSSLFSDFGHEMTTALLPGFLVLLGAPAIGLGVIEGISNFAQSSAELWAGRAADRVRNRAPWIFGGYVATALKALIALVPAWGWIVPIRTVAWIGRGVRGPMRDSLIADDVPRESWGKAYGFREALDTAGAFLGPLTAAVLVGEHLDYRLIIGLTIIPASAAVAVMLPTIREVQHRLERPAGFTLPSMPRSPAFERFLLAATVFTAGYVAPTFFILRAINLLGAQGAAVATSISIGLYTVHNLFYAVVSFPAGSLADRVSPRKLLTLGFLLWTVALVILAAGPTSVAALAIPFVLSGTATAIIEPVQTTFAAQLLPADARGRGLGLLSGLTGFGQLASSLLVGVLWTAFSAPPALAASAVLAVAGLLLLQLVPGRDKQEAAPGQ